MSRCERWAPLSGVLAVALWIVGIILVNHNSPGRSRDGRRRSSRYYKANSNWVLVGGWLFMLGCLAFLWFAEILRERLEDARAAPRTATRMAFAGAIAAAVFGITVPLTDIAAAINKNEISAADGRGAPSPLRRVLRRRGDRAHSGVPRRRNRGARVPHGCCPSGGRG